MLSITAPRIGILKEKFSFCAVKALKLQHLYMAADHFISVAQLKRVAWGWGLMNLERKLTWGLFSSTAKQHSLCSMECPQVQSAPCENRITFL